MAHNQNIKEIVLANRLTDGVVVYLGSNGTWVEHTDEAAIAYDTQSREALTAQADAGIKTQQVTGWEFVEVEHENGTLRIVKNKHFIQSLGPTVRRDLGKQAELAA